MNLTLSIQTTFRSVKSVLTDEITGKTLQTYESFGHYEGQEDLDSLDQAIRALQYQRYLMVQGMEKTLYQSLQDLHDAAAGEFAVREEFAKNHNRLYTALRQAQKLLKRAVT